MADPWSKYQSASPPDDSAGPWQKYQQPQQQQPEGFWHSLGSTMGIPEVWDAATKDPKGFLTGLAKDAATNVGTMGMSSAAQIGLSIAKNAYKHIGQAGGKLTQGDIPGAINEYVGAVPVFGPMAYKSGEQADQGNWPGALGTAAGAIGQAALPELAGRTAPAISRGAAALKRKAFPNVNNPVVEQALTSVEPDVQMTTGQRTGSQGLQRIEQNLPGAQRFSQTQQEQLAAKGKQLATAQSPVQADPYGAGQAVDARLQQRITNLKGQADNLYDQVRQGAASNQQTVQVGTQQVPGPNPAANLTPAGQAISQPVMQTMDSPIDLGPYRAQMKPIFDDLNRLMPEARRQASPAYRALADLMTSDQPYMSAMDFDKSISAIKSIARDGNSPYLTSRSQAIAKQMVQSGEQQLNQALASADPRLPGILRSARNTVRAYYDTADLRDTLNASSQEPSALYNHLVAGGDTVYNSLQQLSKVAPKQLQTVGRTFLEQMLDKATNEGGFARAPGIMAQWERLGPRTKQLLFGPQAADIDNFMIAAKALTKDFNPSGSAKMAIAAGALGAGGEALWHTLTGHPMSGAGAIAGYGGVKLLSKMLLTPGGASKLTHSISPLLQGASVAPMAAGAMQTNRNEMPPPGEPQQ